MGREPFRDDVRFDAGLSRDFRKAAELGQGEEGGKREGDGDLRDDEKRIWRWLEGVVDLEALD